MAIINGKRMSIPSSGMYGSELINHAAPGPGRRAVIRSYGNQFETIKPNKLYGNAELLDKWGNPVKVSTTPDRTKAITYGAIRNPISKTIITEQVVDIESKFLKGGVDFDRDNADWMVAPNFRLPNSWHSEAMFSPLLIIFPSEYPSIPPVGFYLKDEIHQSPNGHLYDTAYHQACKDPLQNGWKWYCVYVKPGSWQPARYRYPGDWRKGDNLWTYFMLIEEVLGSEG
jgi:hypothetical protein